MTTMTEDLLELPLLGEFECLADDALFADLMAELYAQPAADGSPTSSCSENAAIIRCPWEVGSQADALMHPHTITTAAPSSQRPSPSSTPVGRSFVSNLSWLGSLPSAAELSSPEEHCLNSGNTSDSSMDLQGEERPNKRKAPEVDWRSIADPEERRKQRRLAKNRVTAARSRERKKVQLAGMEGRMQQLETDNAQLKSLLEHCMKENGSLREQLASLTRGAGPSGVGGATEPAALLYIAIMLVLLQFLDARGLSQALGLLLFTYVFFAATAAGKLPLKQRGSPFLKQQDRAVVLIKEEPDGGGSRAGQDQGLRQQQAAAAQASSGGLLCAVKQQPAPGLAGSQQSLCGAVKQQLGAWHGKHLCT